MNWTKISIFSSIENEDILSFFLTEISNGISVDYSIEIMKDGIDDFHEKFRLNPDDYPETDIRISVYYDETEDVDSKVKEINEFLNSNDELMNRDSIEVKRSEEHTSELQSRFDLVCRLLL